MNTPVFIISEEEVEDQYEMIADLGCDVVYSRKTNPVVWDVLAERTDAHVACHSINTVEAASTPERTWFFPLATESSTIRRLYDDGVSKFVVDNKDDLATVVDTVSDVEVAVRMKLRENTVKTGRHYVYGLEPGGATSAVAELHEKGVNNVGLHVHRKTQNIAEWSLIDEVGPVVDEVQEWVDFVNIGGGIPVAYESVDARSLDRIFSAIESFARWLPNGVDLYAEPGRFIAGPSTVCKTRIIDIRDNAVFVDWSIFNGCMDAALVNYRLPLVEEEEGRGERYMIKGRSPDSMDVLRYEAWLDDPQVGDVLTFENAGAYNYTTDFCELDSPQVRVVDGFSAF